MMVRKSILDTAVPKLKQYMTEHSEPLTSREVADFLGVSSSTAYSVLLYMESVDIIRHVKSGRKKLYFLKDAYDGSHIATMLSRSPDPRRIKLSKHATPVLRAVDNMLEKEPMVDHNPNLPKDMLPALAILGIYQTDSRKPETQSQVSKQILVEKKRISTPFFITIKRHGRITSIPKEARLLSIGDTTHLKEKYLSELDGYEDIERFDFFFAEASALERGEYGNTFYTSKGTNLWEKVYKVTVKRASSRQRR